MIHAVEVDALTKRYRLFHERNQSLKGTITRGKRTRYEEFEAVRDVTFSVPEGSTFGIIGSNGSGKSTLLKCLAGILSPDEGLIRQTGRLVALLELGAGFHPELTGRENVFLNGAILGMTRTEIQERFSLIVEFAGLERFIDMPVKNYSSGMVMRLGFSIAINVDPDILVIDEILAVGDERFQHKSYEKIIEFKKRGKTIILVSHIIGTVVELCDRVLWLDSGRVMEIGAPKEVVEHYLSFSNSTETVAVVEHRTQRKGSGEVRVSNIQISDGLGNGTGVFSSGSPMRVTFALSNEDYCGLAYVHLSITDEKGQMIWQNGSHTSKILFDTFENSERLVTCDIKSLPLLEGIFQITVTVSNESGSVIFDQVPDVAKFNVLKGSSAEFGLVVIDALWSVS